MMTGMLAVRNAVLGQRHDLWDVNTEPEYQETIQDGSPLPTTRLVKAVGEAFPRLDRFALGVAVSLTSGLCLLLATLILVAKGGEVVGPRLGLLSQYFPGYTVTVEGSMVGALYGLLAGFLAGWSMAFLRNAIVFTYMVMRRGWAERQLLRKLPEYL
jgi:hypothetical protein